MAFVIDSDFRSRSFKAGMPLAIKTLWNKNKTEIDKTEINVAL